MKVSETDLSIILSTSDYRGDHAADIQVPFRHVPGESVEDLVRRTRLDYKDHIIIRRVVEEVAP